MQHSLASTAACLFETGLIDQTALGQATKSTNQFASSSDLLSKILSKIEVDQKWYGEFLSVLRRVSGLDSTADRLDAALREEESCQQVEEGSSTLFYTVEHPVGQSTPVARVHSLISSDSGYVSPLQSDPNRRLSFPSKSNEHTSSDYDNIIRQEKEKISILEREVKNLKTKIVDLKDSQIQQQQQLQENLDNVLTELDDAKLAHTNTKIDHGREITQLKRERLRSLAVSAKKELVMEEELAGFREKELIAMRDKLVEEKEKRVQDTMSRSLETENDASLCNY